MTVLLINLLRFCFYFWLCWRLQCKHSQRKLSTWWSQKNCLSLRVVQLLCLRFEKNYLILVFTCNPFFYDSISIFELVHQSKEVLCFGFGFQNQFFKTLFRNWLQKWKHLQSSNLINTFSKISSFPLNFWKISYEDYQPTKFLENRLQNWF